MHAPATTASAARRRPGRGCVIAKGIGLLIGGVQLLPSSTPGCTARGSRPTRAFAFWGSLHPLNLLQLVAPYLFAGRVVGDNTHEFGLYAGAVPLMLIVWLVGPAARTWAAGAAGLGGAGLRRVTLLLAFGRYGLLYRATTWLPLLRQLPLSLPLPGAVPVGGRRAGGDRVRAVDRARAAAPGNDASPWRPSAEAASSAVALATCGATSSRSGAWSDSRRPWPVAGLKLRHEPYIASLPAVLAGPALLAAAAVLMVVAARGYSAGLVGLILLAAVRPGLVRPELLRLSAQRRHAGAVRGLGRTPPGNADGRVVASLLRFDQPGLRTGDLMTLGGWRRADGYAGLEPRRQLDYRLLPALRVAGRSLGPAQPVDRSTIAGLKPYDDLWLEVPDPLPRVRLVTQTRTSSRPGRRHRADLPRHHGPVRSPAGSARLEAGHGRADRRTARPAGDRGRLPRPAIVGRGRKLSRGWHATVDGRPQTSIASTAISWAAWWDAGKHRVVLGFQPDSLQRGRLTS